MIMERLDGFTADGFGKVIPGEPQEGDVIRINGKIEQRYAPPPPPPPEPDLTKGRALNRAEFIRVGNKTDAVKFNTLLSKMPSVLPLLADYATVRGIDFSDATGANGDNDTRDVLAAAIAMGIFSADDVKAFFAKWVEIFPEGS